MDVRGALQRTMEVESLIGLHDINPHFTPASRLVRVVSTPLVISGVARFARVVRIHQRWDCAVILRCESRINNLEPVKLYFCEKRKALKSSYSIKDQRTSAETSPQPAEPALTNKRKRRRRQVTSGRNPVPYMHRQIFPFGSPALCAHQRINQSKTAATCEPPATARRLRNRPGTGQNDRDCPRQ